jgi:hypothetical protein
MANEMSAAGAAAKAEETRCLIGPKPLSWYPEVPVVDGDEEETAEARRAWWRGWLPRASSPSPRPDAELRRFPDRFERPVQTFSSRLTDTQSQSLCSVFAVSY